MDRQDFVTSSVNLDQTLRCVSVGFNLSRYNSSDQRLRLNHFKSDSLTNRNVLRTPPPPLALSGDQRSQ